MSKFRLKHNFYYFMPEARWDMIDKIINTMIGERKKKFAEVEEI